MKKINQANEICRLLKLALKRINELPECFGSNPNSQDKAENDCFTCKYQDKCLKVNQEWEEEFEDKLDCILKISDLIKKYIKFYSKVKIKVRDGAILIERIK